MKNGKCTQFLIDLAYRLSLSMDFLRCLCGGCRFPADLVFPLGKVTVVLNLKITVKRPEK